LSADARYVAVWLPFVSKLVIIDTSDGERVVDEEQRQDVQGVAFSPDGRSVAVLTGTYGVDATLRVISLSDGMVRARRDLPGETGSALVWGASGIAAATFTLAYPADGSVDTDGMVRVFGQPLRLGGEHVYAFPDGRVESLAATEAGALVLAVNETLRRVDPAPAQEEPPFATPTMTVTTSAAPTTAKPLPLSPLVVLAALALGAIAARSRGRRRP
jgi:hypothetical protein